MRAPRLRLMTRQCLESVPHLALAVASALTCTDQIPTGHFADRVGRKSLVVYGMSVQAVGSVLALARLERPAPRRNPVRYRARPVAKLLADGATNQDIAQTLFLARRTVENHVARVLTKLGTKRKDIQSSLLNSDRPASDEPTETRAEHHRQDCGGAEQSRWTARPPLT